MIFQWSKEKPKGKNWIKVYVKISNGWQNTLWRKQKKPSKRKEGD